MIRRHCKDLPFTTRLTYKARLKKERGTAGLDICWQPRRRIIKIVCAEAKVSVVFGLIPVRGEQRFYSGPWLSTTSLLDNAACGVRHAKCRVLHFACSGTGRLHHFYSIYWPLLPYISTSRFHHGTLVVYGRGGGHVATDGSVTRLLPPSRPCPPPAAAFPCLPRPTTHGSRLSPSSCRSGPAPPTASG